MTFPQKRALMSGGRAHRKVSTLAQTSFKPSARAQLEAHTNPVGPFPKPTCSTSTLGGRGGGIEGEKREYRDVALPENRRETAR